MLKKLLAGCLVLLLAGAVAATIGGYLLYRAATPYVEQARATLQELSELGELDRQITNTEPHNPPASGELTAQQVERFVKVQEHVRGALGERMRAFEEKYRHLNDDNHPEASPSLSEVLGGLRELGSLLVEARRYHVDALNQTGFSQEEYSWVRARVLQAAGVEVSQMIDLSHLEEVIRDSGGRADAALDRLPRMDIPPRNRELVKPLVGRMEQWLPLAFFGL